jgi:hypothetical protein
MGWVRQRGTVLDVGRDFTLEDAIGSMPARLKVLPACGQSHSSRVSLP